MSELEQEKLLDKAFSHAIVGECDQSEKILKGIPGENLAARFNLGWHDLRHGKFLKGFEGLNAGRFIGVFGAPAIPGRIWRDESLVGKTLLLRMEGGLGDEIINFRFAEHFREKGANVIISAHSSLCPIFSAHGFCCVTEAAIPFTYYDYWVPAMSAPYVLGMDYESLPGKPYLNRPSTPRGDRLRIGLRWGGNVENKDVEHLRKVDAQQLIALSELVNADFFSFQRDNDLADVPFTDLRNEMTSWQRTAELLGSMDLLITSCTSVAHMAAAMGVRTWVLVPLLAYYTWAIPGPKSAWHDTVTLFRQRVPGSWDAPVKEIERQLLHLAERASLASAPGALITLN